MSTTAATKRQIFHIDDPDGGYTFPEDACLIAYRGSVAHGMYVPKNDPNSIDDVDLMGVCLGKPENYFGLKEWGSRGTKEVKQGCWDVVLYEIRKAVSLLLQGNPNIVSMLWVHPRHVIYSTSAGRRLRAARSFFVGKHVYNAFAGYAHAQLEKMETRDPAELRAYLALTAEAKARGIHPNHKGERFLYPDDWELRGEAKTANEMSDDALIRSLRSYQKKGENIGYMGDKRKHLVLEHGYDAKNAAHCIRLLRMCREFLETGEMVVNRPDAGELLAIKRGEWTLDQVKQHATELFAAAKSARDQSRLPEKPDYEGAQRLLIEILSEHMMEGK